MADLTFQYYLLFHPMRPSDNPANVMALANDPGPTKAVIWDRPTARWSYHPDVAIAVLFVNPDRNNFRGVDRATAESVTHHFTTVPLPGEAELTRICQETSQT
jgi:hypothetical protein